MRKTFRAFAGLALMAALAACSTTTDRTIALATGPVIPVSVGDATEVSAYELADAMLRAGFTREEISTNGPAVYQALATSGGAQVRQGKVVSAIFAVYGNQLYVTSLSRGTFVLPLGVVMAAG